MRLLHFAHATRHALGISAEHPIQQHRAGRHDSRCLWQRSHDLFERAVLNHQSIPKWGFATTWIESGSVDEYWKWRQLPTPELQDPADISILTRIPEGVAPRNPGRGVVRGELSNPYRVRFDLSNISLADRPTGVADNTFLNLRV